MTINTITRVIHSMWKYITNKGFIQHARTYAIKIMRETVAIVRRDARETIENKLETLSFEQFRRERLEIEGQDIPDNSIDKAFIYLAKHVIDMDNKGNFSITIAGIKLYSVNLFDLERHLYDYLIRR